MKSAAKIVIFYNTTKFMKKKIKAYNLFCKCNEITSRKITGEMRELDAKMYLILLDVFSIADYVKSAYFQSMHVGDEKYDLFMSCVNGYCKIRYQIFE